MVSAKYHYLAGFAAALVAAQAYAAAPLPVKRSNAPIDITADRLEVFQEENRAVFTGRVVAIQDDVKLTSDVMVVHYRRQEEGEKQKEKSDGPRRDSIRRIEVDGNVFLATPTETASGKSGVYDVEHHEIRLNDDVVLTKDKNTIKGDHLTYDMNTGKSVLTSGAGQPEPAHGEAKGKQKDKPRVRALFVPEGGEKKNATQEKTQP